MKWYNSNWCTTFALAFIVVGSMRLDLDGPRAFLWGVACVVIGRASRDADDAVERWATRKGGGQ